MIKLSKILKYGTLVSTYGLIGTVLLQVFGRFILDSAPSWTEEASRFFFVYSVAFAAGLALKQNYYVALDILQHRVGDRMLKRLEICTMIGVVVLFVLITYFSISMITRAHSETSPSMQFKMSYVFFSMFLLGASMSYYSMQRLLFHIKNQS